MPINTAIKENNLASKLSNLSLQLYEKLIKAGYAKSDEEFKSITKFFFERILPRIDTHYKSGTSGSKNIMNFKFN